MTANPRGLWIAARLAVVSVVSWAVVDVIRTTLAVGHYEDRITGVTHGSPDVWPAWAAYDLLVDVMPRGTVTAVVDRSWILGSLAAAAAFVVWLHQARRAGVSAAQPAPVGWWWTSVLVTVLLKGLGRLYDVVTSDGARFEGATLDTRTVAYPLWTVGTSMIVVTAFLTARVVRRITEAQRRIGGAAAIGR